MNKDEQYGSYNKSEMPALCILLKIIDDEMDEDDIEGNKPLTMEEFR